MSSAVDNTRQMRFAWDRAAKLCGGRMRVAEHLNITKQAVYQWQIVPANRCFDIVDLTKGAVLAEELRPDIFRSATDT